MNIYVATSWRNGRQPEVVRALRAAEHEVYDFRAPEPGNNGFHWSAIDPEWKAWDPAEFVAALQHPVAENGFDFDLNALDECEACVLVLPCGRSAHLEAGYAIGCGKPTFILLADGEPELMYKMATVLCTSLDELLWHCNNWGGGDRRCRVCGCTEYDCRQCVEKTGEPCYWVEEDLCSACPPITEETATV